MFKSRDTTTGLFVVSLEARDAEEIRTLRRKGREGTLQCQTCREPVLLKAGPVRRPHFAHRTLANCPTSGVSSEVLEARAVLYEWLRSKFGEGVTLEKTLDDASLPRPIDGWAERDGRRYAWWLVDRRLPPEARVAIEEAVRVAGGTLAWVFLAGMLRRTGPRSPRLLLSTTERDSLRSSEFDEVHGTGVAGSLHYLDSAAGTLTTFRTLSCVHVPQTYAGVELQSPLAEVRIHPTTGEFVHPGEYDRVRELRKRRERDRHRAVRPRSTWEPLVPGAGSPGGPGPEPPPPEEPEVPQDDAHPCEECGQVTTSWWFYDGNTGFCRCHDCARKRREGKSGKNDPGSHCPP
jgi:hypothetical protein